MNDSAADEHEPADERARDHQDQHGGLGAGGVDEEGGQERPARGADEEDVERSEGGPHAPEAVGRDRLQDRPDHRERGEVQDLHHHADDGIAQRVRHRVLDRDHEGDGDDEEADETECLRRVLAEAGVVPSGGERQDAERQDPTEGSEKATLERVEVELFLDVEPAQDGPGEQAEAQRREGDHGVAERTNLLEPREHGLDRHRRGPGVDDLAEHVLHLELAPGRLGDAQREEREDQGRQSEDEERPAPTIGATRQAGDGADQGRADRTDQQAAAQVGGAESAADADRVGVGDQ